MSKLRVLFMGTPDFALPPLKKLNETYDVCAVFCQPDKVCGRGNKIIFGPVKQYAVDNGIPVYQPDTFKNGACDELIKTLDPQIIVVAAYGKILPKFVLDYPKYKCINIHGSLLPKYRGASPIQASILNGDKITGITVMKMAEGLDSGDIILQNELEIGEYETAGELFDRMSELGAESVIEAIESIVNNSAVYTPQNDAESTHVSMINKTMGKLDFSLPSEKIKRLVYGLNPWPSAFIETQSGIVKIHRVVMGRSTDKPHGSIISIDKSGIEVACGDNNTVVITEIQKQGKKKMDAYSFSLGLHNKNSIYDI